MRVAWVTPYPPDRDGGGGQIRQAYLLAAVAATAEVVLVTIGPVRDPEVLRSTAEVIAPAAVVAAPQPRWRRRLADAWGATGSTASREVRALAATRTTLAASLATVAADVVLVEYAGLGPLVDLARTVPALRPARWVLTLHNLPSRMAAQQAAIMPKRRQRWLFGRDVIRARRLERRALSSYDRLVTVSAADAEALGADPKIAVVPNGVDLGRFVPSPLPAAARIVFSGALYTAPNTDAAQWFCRTVLPLVLASVPEVSVDVVGARPPAEVSALSEIPGVSVHADVDSVVPFLEAARVAVVPIRIGSGTRLKALEAWAAGRPVVGTSIGLEGLDVEPGRNAMLADDAPAFAAAVVRVLSDDALARRLAEAGRATVTASYDWAGLGAQLREVLDRA